MTKNELFGKNLKKTFKIYDYYKVNKPNALWL